MTMSRRTILFCTLVAALIHTCSTLFYTNSRENDYPRIGKRYLHLTSVPKSPNEWYSAEKLSEPYWKPDPESDVDTYMWQPILTAIQEHNKVAVDPGLVSGENKYSLLKKLRQSNPSAYESMRGQLRRLLKQQYASLENDDLLPEF